MAKVFFSMAGEGRGHATRARTLIERLRHQHQITVFAPHTAYDMLSQSLAGTGVRLLRIPGLMFHYRSERLSFAETLRGAAGYLQKLPALVRRLTQELRREAPDLIVTDFEPALPRAALKAGIPFVSLDHQHFLVVSDLSCLPWMLRAHACAMGLIVQGFCRGQVETIVSSFYFPPLRPQYAGRVVQTGVLLRDAVLEARPEDGAHLVVYLRRFAPPRLMEALARSGREVQIYGLGAGPSRGGLHFHPVSELRFLQDLATCDALVTNAGNQLVGEALYLGKPVLALPEANNFEQQINGRFLRASRGGDWAAVDAADDDLLKGFLCRADEYRDCPDRYRINGNSAAINALLKHIPGAAHTSPVGVPVREESAKSGVNS